MCVILLVCLCGKQPILWYAGGVRDGSQSSSRKRGRGTLRWSDTLADAAREWANSLIAGHAFHPLDDHRFGGKLFEVSGRSATPSEVVYAWAGEAKNYDHRTNACSARCGHYTQVVWRDTQTLGCAMARDTEREVWVCNYDPLGNILGERPY